MIKKKLNIFNEELTKKYITKTFFKNNNTWIYSNIYPGYILRVGTNYQYGIGYKILQLENYAVKCSFSPGSLVITIRDLRKDMTICRTDIPKSSYNVLNSNEFISAFYTSFKYILNLRNLNYIYL